MKKGRSTKDVVEQLGLNGLGSFQFIVQVHNYTTQEENVNLLKVDSLSTF